MARDYDIPIRSEEKRREFLKKAGATSGVLMTGLAGCSGDGGDGGGDGGSDGSDGGNGGSDGGGSDGGNGGSDGGGGGNGSSRVMITQLANRYWETFVAGYEAASKALGYPNTETLSNERSLDRQLQQVDSAISSEVDMITGMSFINAGIEPIGQRVVEAGIPWHAVWSWANWLTPGEIGEEVVGHQLPHSWNNGVACGVILAEAMGGEGKFVHIDGVRGTTPNIPRNEGFRSVMEQYPNIEQLGETQAGKWVRQNARDIMSDWVAQYGDEIDAVYANNDAMALGALTVAEENGIGPLHSASIDGVPEIMKEIKAGRATVTISANPSWQGGWNVVRCHDWLNGWRPKPPERMMMPASSAVVADTSQWPADDIPLPLRNADNFLSKVFEGDGFPYDWELMSRAESGEDWDPQVKVEPVRKKHLFQVHAWQEKNKPEGYSIPDYFDDTELMDEVAQTYADHFQRDPFAE